MTHSVGCQAVAEQEAEHSAILHVERERAAAAEHEASVLKVELAQWTRSRHGASHQLMRAALDAAGKANEAAAGEIVKRSSVCRLLLH